MAAESDPTSPAFTNSEPLTLGVEEEFLVLDAATLELAPRADELLDGGWENLDLPGGWLKPEMLRCSVEIATAASRDLAQLDVDLRALRDQAMERAAAAGCVLAGIGMHPDLRLRDDELVVPTEVFGKVADLLQRVGLFETQTVHGIHVHVGVPSLADAVAVTDALASHVPLLIACTANSPVSDGRVARWRSARAELMRYLPWGGITPHGLTLDSFVEAERLHTLEQAEDRHRFVWDVAPVSRLGTVELRMLDSNPDPRTPIAVAAFVQAVTAHVLAGGTVERVPDAVERRNRWSVNEHGPRGQLLKPGVDTLEPVADALVRVLEELRPVIDELGTAGELAWLHSLLTDQVPSQAVLDGFAADGVTGALRACVLVPTTS